MGVSATCKQDAKVQTTSQATHLETSGRGGYSFSTTRVWNGRRGSARVNAQSAIDHPSAGVLNGRGAHLQKVHSCNGELAPFRQQSVWHKTQKTQVEFCKLLAASSVCFQAVSRPIELSLQSSLQLSLTVLVRYRSRGHI